MFTLLKIIIPRCNDTLTQNVAFHSGSQNMELPTSIIEILGQSRYLQETVKDISIQNIVYVESGTSSLIGINVLSSNILSYLYAFYIVNIQCL